jgi:type IV fimbrial biogenesis protein FimT
MRASSQAGISLIEVMVVVVIIGILVALGIPSFQTWIQNTQIRTAGEGLINGLQTARNEAIRRNECMQIQLAAKSGWRVNRCADPLADPPFAIRAGDEGSPNANTIRIPLASDTVSFNALGRVINPNPSDGSPVLAQIDVCNPTMTGSMAGDMRPLRIMIPAGGTIRMCDPSPLLSTSDPRKCGPADLAPVLCS